MLDKAYLYTYPLHLRQNMHIQYIQVNMNYINYISILYITCTVNKNIYKHDGRSIVQDQMSGFKRHETYLKLFDQPGFKRYESMYKTGKGLLKT